MPILADRLRRHGLLLALLAVIAVAYGLWSVSAQIGYLGGDGPNYLMLAEHLSWRADKDPVWDAVGRISRFPPAYPLLLGLLEASARLPLAHAATVVCLLFALAALYAWLLGEGFVPAAAALQVLLLAMLPGTWRIGLLIQSEYLYLFLSLLALALLRKVRRAQDGYLPYLAAAVVAAAILTREVGLSLLVPLLVSLRAAPVRTVLLTLAIAVLPAADWHLAHHSPLNYGQVLHDNYQASFAHKLRDQVLTELPALWNGFGSNFLFAERLRPFTAILAAICLSATVLRGARLKPDALYCLANLAILVVWPYPEEAARFLWVLLPVLLVQPLLLTAEWRQESPDAAWPRAELALLAAAIMGLTLPAMAVGAGFYRDAAYSAIPGARGYLPWYQADRKFANFDAGFESTVIDLLQRAQAVIPQDDCVLANRPDMVNYFARRRSHFHPLDQGTDAQFESTLRATGCRYVLTYVATDRRYAKPLYPAERIKGYADVVLEGRLPHAGPDKKPVCLLWKLR